VDDEERDLMEHGVCIIKNVFDKDEICWMQKLDSGLKSFIVEHPRLRSIIVDQLGDDYVFQDYMFIIKKSSIHTCHRDNNGDFYNPDQKHKSYTMLIYLEDQERCLAVIPNSHKKRHYYLNITNELRHLLCKSGDVILFDSNLIHVGTINDKDDHLRIQMKISHRDDINCLSFYQNYHKVLSEDNHLPKRIRRIQQTLTCMFPGMSDLFQKETAKNIKSTNRLQKFFSYLFYGNADFYELQNT
jgi:ectoine hydroxylase-related dioxygenase (phytanoyl-CoA dioxygenase family)